MEPVFLCRSSAFEALHMLRTVGGAPSELDPSLRLEPLRLERSTVAVSPRASSADAVKGLLAQDEAARDSHWTPTTPLHVLVSADTASRRPSDLRVPHRAPATIPQRSFVEVAPGVYASSPEFLYLEMAAHGLDLLDLVWLASVLCATYSCPGPHAPILPSRPLTSTDLLHAFLVQAVREKVRGARKALDALPYVVECAASPREIMVPLLACLPLRMGGWNLPKPQLNQSVEADRRLAGSTGPARFSLDMLWPEAKLAAEYDSYLHHADPKRRARDNETHAELQRRGYRVEAISTGQLAHADSTDRIMQRLAGALGVRTRICDCAYNWYDRRLVLRKRLWNLEANGIPWG